MKAALLCALVGYSGLLAWASLMPVSRESALAATAARRALNNALHVPAYAVLGLLWIACLRAWGKGGHGIGWVVTGSLLAAAYGALAEAAQAFVPGRVASATDLFLNTLGVCAAVAAQLLWLRHASRRLAEVER